MQWLHWYQLEWNTTNILILRRAWEPFCLVWKYQMESFCFKAIGSINNIYIYNISIHNPKFIFLFKLYTIYVIIYLIAVVFSNCLWICIDSRAICCWWRGSFLVNSCPIICLLYFSIFLSRMVELSILIVYFLVSCDSPQISPFCSQLMNDQYCDVSVWRRVDRLKDDVLGDC